MAPDENKYDGEQDEQEDWIPTREEKVRYVIYLHQKGKSYREIARVVHVSFSDISKIIREQYGYPAPKKDESQLSNETRALKLFQENRQPVEVAIELDIPSEEAINYYQKYQQLIGMSLHEYHLKLKKEIQQLESNKYNLNSQVNYLRNEVAQEAKCLEFYKSEWQKVTNELAILYNRKAEISSNLGMQF